MRMRNVISNALLILAVFAISPAPAATLVELWNTPDTLPLLNQFYFNNQLVKQHNELTKQSFLFSSKNKQTNAQQSLKAIQVALVNKASHVRYAQYWHGIPVWGTQVIVHHKNHTNITGTLLTGIENDVTSVTPALSTHAAEDIALSHLQTQQTTHALTTPRALKTKLMIMPAADNATEGKARLAYHVTFYINDNASKQLQHPVFLIDADTGNILLQYDNLQTDAVGTGPGGNDITGLSFRSTNHYQFGNALGGLPSFGAMPVDTEGTACIMQTSQVRLSSYNDVVEDDKNFPVYYNQEAAYPVFSYNCDENATDGGLAPYVHAGGTSYSPSNDSYYFAQMTYQMMQTFIPDVTNPWGPSLPIRVYSHVGKLDNAFAFTPVDDEDEPLAETHASFNAQFIVGDGDTLFYPLSDSGTIGHELSHIYTAYHANLIYSNQSGGINEAYSDIAGQTLEFWLSQQYPWYGFDWQIGPEVALPTGRFAGKALRYFNYPPLDGHSIANAADFVPGINVHYSSGVFNYSFYLMVTKYNIDIYNAYRYFSHANAAYWTPSSSFNNASCGVMQAALDMGNQGDFQKITQAFRDVGVKCKIGAKANLTAL